LSLDVAQKEESGLQSKTNTNPRLAGVCIIPRKMSLPKTIKISLKKEIQRISRSRPLLFGQIFSIRAERVDDGPTRFMVLVPVRIAKSALIRNKLRRQVSESIRRIADKVKPGLRIAVSVQKITLPPVSDLDAALLSLLDKSGMLAK
jgi:ribonuclease P protein component